MDTISLGFSRRQNLGNNIRIQVLYISFYSVRESF